MPFCKNQPASHEEINIILEASQLGLIRDPEAEKEQ